MGNRKHSYVKSANWDTAAIIDDEYKIIYSTEMHNMRSFEVRRKSDYSLVENPGDIMKKKKSVLLESALKMAEFYR